MQRTRDIRKSGDRVENTEHTETMDTSKYRARELHSFGRQRKD